MKPTKNNHLVLDAIHQVEFGSLVVDWTRKAVAYFDKGNWDHGQCQQMHPQPPAIEYQCGDIRLRYDFSQLAEGLDRRGQRQAAPLKQGDHVAYSAAFLRSVGIYSGEMPQLRGQVIELQQMAHNRQLATVRWDSEQEPQRVLSSNLAHVGPNSRFCAC